MAVLPACAQQAEPAVQAPAVASAEAASLDGPALWKVADEDTTVYLFGTIHALPEGKDWYSGTIAKAFDASGELVTEIPAGAENDPATAQLIQTKAMLPAGTTLRSKLTDTQRATYEEALAKLNLPAQAFDQFKPWFAGMTLGLLPLLQQGYSPEAGVEKVLEGKAGEAMTRGALETAEYQISVFDGMLEDAQISFLVETAEGIDDAKAKLDAMVSVWMAGDADRLAALMNEELTDPMLAERLLYTRNGNWAEWIDERLDEPGTVFIAVGAGHLAGRNSVQDKLAERDLKAVRVQ
ncbi:TraB/GumN family protein [Altererythrobacter sp. HHU K3-1]|uniref:TraB/GumN family protein n=1 Tax=Qipengyuania atrilutea TaxID=2744473 RepID=A0A850H3V9_9SPHN|nr:TraB/GumN family protein [Actirhodobacter atriluteus]